MKERAILTSANDSAVNINNALLEKLPTDMMRYESVDSVVEVEDIHYHVEFFHTLNPPGVPPHVLCLQVDTPIMLLPNLNPPKLRNGTRLQEKTLYKHVTAATVPGRNLLRPPHSFDTVTIPLSNQTTAVPGESLLLRDHQ